ncbi:hypothetical protein CDV36_005244 [Fusarium kuroshium]|uniref:Uncharacterized protein n=1 Tax=Fusarium kuroshium TaxID=2010991 RepID=A0A3M2SC11_9HYPO|nr:hypothetical protein CDV36_005244 [Fusarium kuroshium]
MPPPSVQSKGESFEDALSELSLPSGGNEAKAATERLLMDAISKADKHVRDRSKQPHESLNELVRDLFEPSGLCAWHSRKLTRLLRLVRADRCNLQMVRDLEKPLLDFFDKSFGGKILVTAKDYSFYDGIDLEDDDGIGKIDADLLFLVRFSSRKEFESWQDSLLFEYYAAADSRARDPPAVETLGAVLDSLDEWRRRIRSTGTKKGRAWKAMVRIIRFVTDDKAYDSDSNEREVPLGATPEEFERLINSMWTPVHRIRQELYHLEDATRKVTSSQQQRSLAILQDDIRLQVRHKKSQNRQNYGGSPSTAQQDLTPYQKAQALQGRVKEWVQYETEFCEFRERMAQQISESLRS